MTNSHTFRDIPIEHLCSKVTTGATPLRSRNDYYQAGTIDWYKTGELKDWYLDPSAERITEKALKETSAKLFPAGTVLMAMYGDGKTITSLGMLRAAAATNQACSAMLVDEKKCDPCYFFYALKSRRHLLLKVASGGAQRNLSGKLIKEFTLPVPSLAVQRRIADMLSAYDKLIENNHRRIKILEKMASALYRERFFGNPDEAKGSFGDLVTIDRTGINPFEFPEEEFEHFSLPAFDNGRSPVVEPGAGILSGKYCIDATCVLLSKLNPRIPRIWCPLPSGLRRSITSTEFLVLKPKQGVTREFVYAKCRSEEFTDSFSNLAIGTSTSHQRVKPDNLLRMPCHLPRKSLIAGFSELTAPMLRLAEHLRVRTYNLRSTRDMLLPRFLSGQLNLLKENSPVVPKKKFTESA